MSDNISHSEYDQLETYLENLDSDLQTTIEDHYRTAELDGTNMSELIEFRGFEQGKVAAMRQFLPFAMFDNIFFNSIKAEAEDIKIQMNNEKDDDDAKD